MEPEIKTKMEFAVEMTCDSCVKAVTNSLKDKPVEILSMSLENQQMVVETTLPFQETQNLIESSGKRASLIGFGTKALESAVVELKGSVNGMIRMMQLNNDNCLIEGTVDGLTPGLHGLNIHEFGDLSNGCLNCGDHFNPSRKRHGGPSDADRHAGDLGNIIAEENGRSQFRFLDKQIKIWDIIGRSLVIHSDKDDFGKGIDGRSKENGNSGPGVACGIVARSSGLKQNSKVLCTCDGIVVWDERNVPVAGKERTLYKQNL